MTNEPPVSNDPPVSVSDSKPSRPANETDENELSAAAEQPATPQPEASPSADSSPEESQPRTAMKIGSQRDPSEVFTRETKEAEASASPGEEESGEHSAPSGSGRIDSELEQEIEAALGDTSIEQIMMGDASASASESLEVDTRCKGTVSRVHRDNVFFTLKGRYEGVASLKQFKKPPEAGAMMDVVVTGFNSEDGLYELGIPGMSVEVGDWSDLKEGMVVETRITGSNTGGLECIVNNIRGFIPASQISLVRVENLAEYINQKLQCVVTEANPKRRNLVLSHRAILEREQQEKRKELFASLQVGSTCDGVVTRLREFGAFVDIGGVEGLVHISKMSWDRIEHPKEVLQEGQKVQVKIEKVNAETGKISLSYRDTMEHPWKNIDSKYSVNSTVKGTVSRIAQFGAFVKLEPGVEGLVHISELAHHRVVAVKNIVNEGDEVEVKVISIDPDAQKMGLSLKATQPAPEKPAEPSPEEAGPSHRPLAVPRRKGPLKGGTDRKSGGESFGLKW